MNKSKLCVLLAAIPLLACCAKSGNNSSNEPSKPAESSNTESISSEAPASSVDPSSISSVAPASSSQTPKDSSTSGNYDNSSSNSSVSSSSNPSSSSSSIVSSSSVEPVKGWTDAERAIFEGHLNGYVIPYYEMEGNKVSYNAQDDVIYVHGAEATPEDLEAYAELFLADDFVAYDAGDNYYLLEKEIRVEGDIRVVNINMCAVDEDGYYDETGYGDFELAVTDPYLYEWPAEDIAEQVDLYSPDTETVVPEFEANYYEVAWDISGESETSLYCYTHDSSSEDDYYDTLEAAGWTMAEDYDDYGYLNAVSPDGTINVQFGYDPDYEDLDIYISSAIEPEAWPADDIQDAVDAITGGSGTTLPVFEECYMAQLVTDYFGYDLLDLFGYYVIYAYTDDEDAEFDYAFECYMEGWLVAENTQTSDGGYLALSPNEDLFIQFFYDADYGDLDIYLMPYEAAPTYTEWPAEEIAEYVDMLVEDTLTVIPEFDAAEYELSYQGEYDTLIIYATGFEDGALEDYLDDIELLGWTVYEDATYYDTYHCISPNEDIIFAIELNEAGDLIQFTVQIYYEPVEGWPEADLANLIANNDGIGVVPAPTYANVTSFEILNDGWGIGVTCFVPAGESAAAAAAYEAQLQAAGWVATGDNWGCTQYQYVGYNIALDAYETGEDWFTIEIAIKNEVYGGGSGTGGDDVNYDDLEINEGLALWCERMGFQASLPDFDDLYDLNADVLVDVSEDPSNQYGIYYDFYVFSYDDDLEEIFDFVVEALQDSDFEILTYDDTIKAGYSLVDENLLIYVELDESLGCVYVSFYTY